MMKALILVIPALIAYQFIGHQFWNYFGESLRYPFFIALAICSLPYFAALISREETAPVRISRPQLLIFALVIVSTIWMLAVTPWIALPPHIYGDETHHFQRILEEIGWWHGRLRGEALPFPGPWFVFYPSLGYLPSVALGAWFDWDFSTNAIAMARSSLAFWLVLTAVASYKLVLEVNFSRKWHEYLVLALLLSWPLMYAYQLSIYVEFQYVPLQLTSLFFALRYLRTGCHQAWIVAIGFAALSTLVRESSWPFALSISAFLSAREVFQKHYFWGSWGVIGGTLPFFLYFSARYLYTAGGHDGQRLSIAHLWQQDWLQLLLMSPYYLSVAGCLAILAFVWTFAQMNRAERMLLGAICVPSLTLTLLEYGVFLPGWMPWSRNYLMLLAPLIVIVLISSKYALERWNGRLATATIVACVALNAYVLLKPLVDNRYFHENEAIFDVQRLLKDARIPADAEIFDCRPEFFRHVSELSRVKNVCPGTSGFFPWNVVREQIPENAQYVLYYHYRNRSLPKALSKQPTADPAPQEDERFEVLSRRDDPFSGGVIGASLLKRRNTTEISGEK